MPANALVKTGNFVIKFLHDGVIATIQLHDPKSKNTPSSEEITAELERAKVKIDDAICERIEQIIEDTREGNGPVEPLIIAEGVRPVQGRDEQVLWDEPFRRLADEWQEGLPPDAYPIQAIARVEPGQCFGTVQPAAKPKDGRNLTGELLKSSGSFKRLAPDETIERATDDTARLVALTGGHVVQQGMSLTIRPILSIEGNVGQETGHVTAESPLWIEGRIGDRYVVRTAGQICVNTSIEAAYVESGGSIYVRRGIVGRRSGLVKADEDIVAKFVTDAYLVAGRDLRLATELTNTHACVGRNLIAPTAGLIGGSVYVGGTIAVDTIGSDADIPTRVVLGVKPRSVFELSTLEKRIRAAERLVQDIKSLVQPLQTDTTRLNTDQRAQLRSLVAQTEKAEGDIERDRNKYLTLLETVLSDQPATLSVTTMINAKTTICLRDRMTTFEREMRGPIRIERRKIKNVTELVTVNARGEVIRPLPNERVAVDDVVRGLEVTSFEPA